MATKKRKSVKNRRRRRRENSQPLAFTPRYQQAMNVAVEAVEGLATELEINPTDRVIVAEELAGAQFWCRLVRPAEALADPAVCAARTARRLRVLWNSDYRVFVLVVLSDDGGAPALAGSALTRVNAKGGDA